jgi:DNA-binding NtrC family response regulator
MNVPWQILVASSDLERRRSLMQTLTRQGIDPIGVSNLAECKEVLQKERVGLVFCDNQLADGTYRDLLGDSHPAADKVRLVVTSRHPDWDEYLEAMRFGAFDVIASPCRPTDVEWMVIQAKRDERNHGKELIPAGADQLPSYHRAAAGGGD